MKSSGVSCEFSISRSKLLVIFFLALTIRSFFFLQLLDHPEVVKQPDSGEYISLANGLLQHGSFCHIDKPGDPNVMRMPGYPVFLSSVLWLFHGSLLAAVIIQIVLDSLSCVLISYLGELIQKNVGFLCGILATVNMGMITYSHFILTDSLFIFVLVVLLIFLFRFMQESTWRIAAILAFTMGLAVYVRSVALYLPVIILIFLFLYLIIEKGFTLLKTAGRILFIALIFVSLLSPWYVRNHIHYGRFQLMAQSGAHMLKYVVPFIWQYSKAISFMEGMKRTEEAFSEEIEKQGIDLKKISPFERSDLQVELAIDFIKKEPVSAIMKAFVFGMAKNVFAPAIIDLSYLLKVKRPHFFNTKGNTFIERTRNFIRNMEGFFSFAVMGSMGIMIVVRTLQLWGFISLVHRRTWHGLCLFLTILYFLLVSGPVGYAKYRLPFEPLLVVLLGIGINLLYVKLTVLRGSGMEEKSNNKIMTPS